MRCNTGRYENNLKAGRISDDNYLGRRSEQVVIVVFAAEILMGNQDQPFLDGGAMGLFHHLIQALLQDGFITLFMR